LVSPTATTATAPPPRPLQLPDASALVARPNEPRGTAESSEQPAAQRPQTARPPSVSIQRRPPTRRLQPGDLICPECGEGNPTTRKFCSRCGTSLEAAQLVKKKWWQYLIPRRGPKKRTAGDRPSARRTRKSFPSKVLGVLFGGVSRVIGVILIIGGVLYGLVPGIRNTANDDLASVKNKVNSWIHPTRTEVQPTDVFVNRSLPNHGDRQLGDTKTNTYWAAKKPPASFKIVMRYNFSSKFDLKNIAVWNGVGDSKDPDYNSVGRPRNVFLTFPGTTATCSVTLGDVPAAAWKKDVSSCHANGVTEVDVAIDDYYGPLHPPFVAMAKMQFFKKG
jgi:zinc-ribbon domain